MRRLALARPERRLLPDAGRPGRPSAPSPARELFADALLHRLAAGAWAGSSSPTRSRSRPSARACGLRGFVGLPTFSRRDARHQYLFVNRRPVQDRLLRQALRAAYSDLLFHDRQPVAALFLELAAGAGRRQRPPGQGRGALPRAGPGPRPGHRRPEAGAGRARPPQPPPPADRALGAFRAGRRARQPAPAGLAEPGLAETAGPAARRRPRRRRCRQARGPRAGTDRGRRSTRWVPRAPSCTAAGSWPRPRTA